MIVTGELHGLAKCAAMQRASLRVSSFAAERPPGSSSKKK